MQILQKKWGHWLVFMTLAFIWGSSFILIKKSLIALPPDVMGNLRLAFTFLLFLPMALKNLHKLSLKNLKSLLIVGFVGNFFPFILYGFAETKVPSALAGMLNASTPLFTWLVGLLFYSRKTTWRAVVGIILGFIGVIGLISQNPLQFFKSWNSYALLILLASLFYGINTNELKYKLKDLDPISIASLGFFLVGPWAILWLVIRGFPWQQASHPQFFYSLAHVFLLAFFCSFLALILFNYFIKHTSAIWAASITYVIPIFAIFWGLLDGEKIYWWQLIFMLIIILGVYLVSHER